MKKKLKKILRIGDMVQCLGYKGMLQDEKGMVWREGKLVGKIVEIYKQVETIYKVKVSFATFVFCSENEVKEYKLL